MKERGVHYTPKLTEYDKKYFTIESLEDNNTISIENTSGNDRERTFYYSTDNRKTWTNVTVAIGTKENIAVLNESEKVLVKSNNDDRLSNGNGYHVFSGSNDFKVYGNIMSLLRGDNFVSNPELPTVPFHFYRLFYNVTTLVDAENLVFPFTKTQDSCCKAMFKGCTNLIKAPQLRAIEMKGNNSYADMFRDCTSLVSASKLPATTLGNYCYANMFNGCSSLVTAPVLPATILKRDCYNSMFKGCTSLVNAPLLPATTSAESCYNSMFNGCTALTTAPELPATTLATACYRDMFNGCTSLTTAPALPATTLANSCYRSMFEGCTSLVNTPILPATTLADNCYDLMFKDCTSLTMASELPALTLAKSCYSSMFRGCISLAEAPELPATTLADYCYNRMFLMSDSEKLMTPAMTKAPVLPAPHVLSYCYSEMFRGNGNLNEVICLAEDTSPQSIGNSTTNWLTNCSSTGTFVKSTSATGWSRNQHGIPTGWNVYTDELTSISIIGNPITELKDTAYKISTVPSDSYYIDVTWSVLSGNALISQDGVLTPLEEGEVTIQAVSTYDSSIVATKTIDVQNDAGYEYKYFTIKSRADNNTISIENVNCDVIPSFYYSTDDGSSWTNVTVAKDTIENIAVINNREKLLLKSTSNRLSDFWSRYNRISASQNFIVYGNINSLLYGDAFDENPELTNSTYQFAELLSGSTTLLDAQNLILPSSTASEYSYDGLFRDCTNLSSAPKLPAMTLGDGCYSSMFEGCISLLEAPELPAKTLATACYKRMFCMSRTTKVTTPLMTKSPVLPAPFLTTDCYLEMFKGNGNLNEVTCLATYKDSGTTSWLQNVSSTGTFNKHISASVTDWGRGDSGIPNGWLVNDSEILIDMAIIGDNTITGETTYTILYNPSNTIYTSVTWSVTSGDATVNQSGVLTPGSTFGNITIQAVSTYDSSIVATKIVEYADGEVLNSIAIVGNDTISLTANTYSIEYNPSYTVYTGITWSVVSGNATITQGGVLTPASTGDIVIQAVSTHDSSIVATKNISVQDTSYTLGTAIQWDDISEYTYVDTGLKIRESLEADLIVRSSKTGNHFLNIGGRNSTGSTSSTDGITLYIDCTTTASDLKMEFRYMNVGTTEISFKKYAHYNIAITSANTTVNGSVYTYDGVPTIIEPSYTAYIGSFNQPTQPSYVKGVMGGRMFSLTIDGNTFLPAKRLSDNKVGLYCESMDKFIDFSPFNAEMYVPQPHEDEYFTIESLADGNAITIQNVNCDVKPTFYYSLDGGDTWSSVTMTKRSTQNIATINTGDKILFKSINDQLGTDWDKYNRFNGSKNFKVQGNIMSLLYGDDFVNNPEFANGSAVNFAGLFKSTTTIVDASNLILPSTKVNTNSYNGTFRDCANLVYAPKLPATNLNGKGCYSSMFEGCISLVEAPELPATTLIDECYFRMFCMSRTAKLTTPAMTKSPILPATSLGSKAGVYKEMFKGNGNLTEVICLASKNRVAACFTDWLLNCSDTGVFKKDPSATWDSGDAAAAIPSGWTVIDAS